MISAPNHQPLLSGNRFVIFCLLMVIFASCATKKPGVAVDKSKVQIVKSDTTKGTTPKPNDPPTLPEIDKMEDNTKSVKRPSPVNTKVDVIVDTVKWVASNPVPPITSKVNNSAKKVLGRDMKEEYNVTFLIPLNADRISEGEMSQSRFIHYYAGALIALERLDDEQIKLNVSVIDTEGASYKVSQHVSDIVADETDLIIGPFERDDVKLVAEACKTSQIPMVSPWQTSTKITTENPYYIQMKPNLKEHYLKLAESTCREYKKEEVAIIGLNNKETNSWIKYFQDAARQYKKKDTTNFYVPYFVTNDSLNLGPSAFFRLFKNPNIKAIILPHYSYNDEDFIYSSLRRLVAEKAGRNITVYGMPILYDSEKIDFDYYNALQMRIVMSDFVDENVFEIKEFRRKYLDLYGEIPTAEAIKGYDMMLYVGRNIWKYGKNFQNFLNLESMSLMQSTFDIRKSKADDAIQNEDNEQFDFFENKHLDIIEFMGTRFVRRA